VRKLLCALAATAAAGLSLSAAPALADGGTATSNTLVTGSSATSVTTSTTTISGNTFSVQLGLATGTVTPACAGVTCDGLDPFASGCANDATTVALVPQITGTQVASLVELRHSAACGASYAQVTTFTPAPMGLAPWPVLNGFVNVTDTAPAVTYAGLQIVAGDSWTAMAHDGLHTQACIDINRSPAPFDCTPVF
jgi:hypothetical protein